MTQPLSAPTSINGWSVFLHPTFIDQIEELIAEVEVLRERHPVEYVRKNATKRLAAISRLAFEAIPQDPAADIYRLGTTMGDEYRHWRRAKFFQQYRLFFRYDARSRIIIYAWVNDDQTKRAYGRKSDAYRVFRRMLDDNNPPDSWDDLLAEANGAAVKARLVLSKVDPA